MGKRVGYCLLWIGGVLLCLCLCWQFWEVWGHGRVITRPTVFTESSRKLENPYRGFYDIHGFLILDEVMDLSDEVRERLAENEEVSLTMIQINLQNFAAGEISEQGLSNVENLFQAFSQGNKHWIVRFVYDWEGKNAVVEPEHLDVILGHMKQLEECLRKYRENIFVVQGLFVGNWGEMHGSKFLGEEDLQVLARQLAEVTDESTFLAVRTPAQWRGIMRNHEGMSADRLGLYNDGMLGSETDCGTYGDGEQDRGEGSHGDMNGADYAAKWSRREELLFQEELCRKVPLGGEVIIDNVYNDFENAVADMSLSHVTYLNGTYDAKVLEKWEHTLVTEEGCYQGMDGLSYVERHLGYRLVLGEVSMDYHFWKDCLDVAIDVQNVGFAPLYRGTEVSIVLVDAEGRILDCVKEQRIVGEEPAEGGNESFTKNNLQRLSGGIHAEEILSLQETFRLKGLEPGKYKIYLQVKDVLSGKQLLFGNEQDAETLGYCVGEVEVLPMYERGKEY